jgi:hypothetical protein
MQAENLVPASKGNPSRPSFRKLPNDFASNANQWLMYRSIKIPGLMAPYITTSFYR